MTVFMIHSKKNGSEHIKCVDNFPVLKNTCITCNRCISYINTYIFNSNSADNLLRSLQERVKLPRSFYYLLTLKHKKDHLYVNIRYYTTDHF